jgi:sugar (pentulose or hexulose) kinase
MATVVLDVGKTHSKLSVIAADGSILMARSRANTRHPEVLDATNVEAWLIATLREVARQHEIEAIVPVAHGATAAYVTNGELAAPVLDYEADIPAALAKAYDALRDPFAQTLSPRLPHGLNLGAQLFRQEQEVGARRKASILLWPQYWAWVLSGAHVAEVTSLGCHTDLWRPLANTFSMLAEQQGWSQRLGPVTAAGAVVGQLRPKLAAAIGLSSRCEILCGLHDSNAALLSFAELQPFTLISTGTWFVAMRHGCPVVPPLDEERDTLGNVDVGGRVVPSARFMGGREYEAIAGEVLDVAPDRAVAQTLIARGIRTRPSFVPGCGPFPKRRGAIVGDVTASERTSLAALHLALMTDVTLDLIGSEGPVIVEGRFAENAVFCEALAALRSPVLRATSGDGVALGAWRLRSNAISPRAPAACVALDADLLRYRDCWRAEAVG